METFIAQRIMGSADITTNAGKDKYRIYFVNTKIYSKYKPGVDVILNTTSTDKFPDGYGEIIVTI